MKKLDDYQKIFLGIVTGINVELFNLQLKSILDGQLPTLANVHSNKRYAEVYTITGKRVGLHLSKDGLTITDNTNDKAYQTTDAMSLYIDIANYLLGE